MNLQGRKLSVKDGNVDKALRKLKKKMADSGIFQELQKRERYTKPSIEKKLALSQAKKRWQRYVESQKL